MLYVPLNHRTPVKVRYWKIFIDHHVTLIPAFAYPYLFLYPFMILAVIGTWNSDLFDPLMLNLSLAAVTGALFWYFIPTAIHRPKLSEFRGRGVGKKLMRFIYEVDGTINAFPSAHVFYALICGYFLGLAYPLHFVSIYIVVATIVLSTILTRQHYTLDISGGALWAFASVTVLYYIS